MVNMNDIEYDPFLGDVPVPVDVDKANAAAGEGEPTGPLPEALRNAELALNLRDNAAAGWLYWITNSTLGEKIGPDAFLVFRKLMLEEEAELHRVSALRGDERRETTSPPACTRRHPSDHARERGA